MEWFHLICSSHELYTNSNSDQLLHWIGLYTIHIIFNFKYNIIRTHLEDYYIHHLVTFVPWSDFVHDKQL